MEPGLLEEEIMKRKKLEEMLFIRGDINSDDEISFTCGDKIDKHRLKMSASAKARATKEAELEKMRKRREIEQRKQSDSDESEEESDDATDSDTDESDESFDENDDDEAQLRAIIEKAKEKTSKLQAEHRKFVGDCGMGDDDEKKTTGKNKKPPGKMAGAGDGSSQPRRSLRIKEQRAEELDDDEDIFLQRLKQKEKELKEKYKIDKIPFLNDPALNQSRTASNVVGASSESSDSEMYEKTVGQLSKNAKPSAAVKPTSTVAAVKKAPPQKKNLSNTEAELKKKFEHLKKLLPPKTEEIESALKKIKKPGHDQASTTAKKLEQLQSTPGKVKPVNRDRPARIDSANAAKGRSQLAPSSEKAIRNKSPTAPVKQATAPSSAKAASARTPGKKMGGMAAAGAASAFRLSDLDSEPVRDTAADTKKSLSTSLFDIGSSPKGRMVLRSGTKLSSSKIPENLNVTTTKIKPKGTK